MPMPFLKMHAKSRFHLLLLLTAMLASVPNAWASFEEAANAYNAHRYPQALHEFERLGALGEIKAQLYAGLMHDNGLGTPKDPVNAFNWYLKAALQGDPRAQFNVAEMLYQGSGINKDIHQSLGWYERAASHGFPEAQYKWGLILSEGKDTKQDITTAWMWLEIASMHSQVVGIEQAIKARDQLTKKLTPKQLEEARGKVNVWFKLQHDQKNALNI
ncbi:MAG: sel1 repeat family protein [Zetaproteobacteria bacterium]|nr:sel1 repeat family protein [Zetaproteobacteria bacterium]